MPFAALLAGALFGCKPAEPRLIPTGRAAATEPTAEIPEEPGEPVSDWPLIEEAAALATQAEAARFAALYAAENGLSEADIRLESAPERRFYVIDEAGEAVRFIGVTSLSLYSAGADESLGDAALLFSIAADMGPETGGEAILGVWRGGADELPDAVLGSYDGLRVWEAEEARG